MENAPHNDLAKAHIRLEAGAKTATLISDNGLSDITTRGRLQSFSQDQPLLFAVAYHRLGSTAEAEDLLQETFIRWQQMSEVEIESPRALLVTILTRLCINHLQSARIRGGEYFSQWLPEPLVTAPSQKPAVSFEVDESLSLAFLVAPGTVHFGGTCGFGPPRSIGLCIL